MDWAGGKDRGRVGNKAPGGLKMRHFQGLGQKLQKCCTGEQDSAQEKGLVMRWEKLENAG